MRQTIEDELFYDGPIPGRFAAPAPNPRLWAEHELIRARGAVRSWIAHARLARTAGSHWNNPQQIELANEWVRHTWRSYTAAARNHYGLVRNG